jgi:hypothetical protein
VGLYYVSPKFTFRGADFWSAIRGHTNLFVGHFKKYGKLIGKDGMHTPAFIGNVSLLSDFFIFFL